MSEAVKTNSVYHPVVGDLEPFPGHASTRAELASLRFAPLTLKIRGTIALFTGTGCEWDTLGTVPSRPGHYLFAVEDDSTIRVTYGGLTEELWMVTKGRLPDGLSRPANDTADPSMPESLANASICWWLSNWDWSAACGTGSDRSHDPHCTPKLRPRATSG